MRFGYLVVILIYNAGKRTHDGHEEHHVSEATLKAFGRFLRLQAQQSPTLSRV
jgi:imidazoleglycerol phosphate dehydratase HisB